MENGDSDAGIGARVFLVGFGALAAFCLWVLADSWGNNFLDARPFLALFTFAAVLFGVSLALTGPLPIGRSVLGGLMLAVPVSALITWAGFRFNEASQFLDDPSALAIAGLIVLFATPFVSTFLTDRARWLEYEALFDTAWAIAVRYVAGWLFVAVFWIVVFLSNALLELVDIDIIDVLFDVDWVRFALSGAMLGLGLAVAFELRDYVSPRLVLRMLRLLLPILLAVVAVFVAVLPLRGLTQLFGDFSSAATLMGVAIASISLISIALDRDDHYGINTRGMKAAARALAFLLPVLSGLALWAVILRVAQYSWTPERVLAATVAAVLLLYGAIYALAALRGRGWRGAIRKSNVTMSLVALTVAALWLTPVLNPERISAQSQLERYVSGKATVDQLPLWELSADWGRAGQAVVSQLRLQAEQAPDGVLSTRLAALDAAESRFQFERSVENETVRQQLGDLVSLIAVRPEGAVTLSSDMFSELPQYRLTRVRDGCTRSEPDVPTCVWIVGAFVPGLPAEDQGILLFASDGRVAANHMILDDGVVQDRVRELYDNQDGTWGALPRDAIEQVLSGAFSIVPSGILALEIGDNRLVPQN